MRLSMLLLFIGVPIVELALLIELGRNIGFWWTIAIVILTAFVGTAVLQKQGLQTFARFNQELESGKPPIMPAVEGMFLLIAGAFLLTPGILTDSFGFLLLILPIRHFIAKWCLRRFVSLASVHIHMSGMGQQEAQHNNRNPGAGPSRSSKDSGPIIDGDFVRVDEKAVHQPSGENARD